MCEVGVVQYIVRAVMDIVQFSRMLWILLLLFVVIVITHPIVHALTYHRIGVHSITYLLYNILDLFHGIG